MAISSRDKLLKLVSFIILVVSITVLGLGGSCSSPNLQIFFKPDAFSSTNETVVPLDSPLLPARGFYMGVMPTPGDGQSFAASYKEASKVADFVPVWGSHALFYDLAKELSGSWGRTYVTQYIRQNGMFPIVNLSFFGYDMKLITPPGLSGASLEDPKWRQAYKQAAMDVVRAVKPLYLSLGNEVNLWYEYYGAFTDEPTDFKNFATLYSEIYQAVKQLSPATQVFCTFAREVVIENTEADLDVLDMFKPEEMDILVFTSFPYSVQGINKPSDVPDDYYSRASDYMPGKPFGLTELGWAASDEFGGESDQADFLMRVSTKLTIDQGIDLKLLGWAWLHSIDEADAVGLIKRNGDNRLVHVAWLNLFTKK